jgi:hypothetical protein
VGEVREVILKTEVLEAGILGGQSPPQRGVSTTSTELNAGIATDMLQTRMKCSLMRIGCSGFDHDSCTERTWR